MVREIVYLLKLSTRVLKRVCPQVCGTDSAVDVTDPAVDVMTVDENLDPRRGASRLPRRGTILDCLDAEKL